MANPESESGDIFQLENFRKLVEIMRENDLNEVEMRQGAKRMRLRRGGIVVPPAPELPRLPAPPVHAPVAAAPTAAAPAAPASEDHLVIIRSRTVGTFYTRPNPESPTFVKVGDHVGPETIVCLIEAMKVFNEMPAEVSGKIVGVLMNNGDPVEFNQPLFKVDPRG